LCTAPQKQHRQPHNRYDRNSIEILSGEAKLGYVPRSENRTIAERMDKGIRVQAEIKELNPKAGSFDKVKVDVWYERPIVSKNIIQDNCKTGHHDHI
jgi:hypothetical protein